MVTPIAAGRASGVPPPDVAAAPRPSRAGFAEAMARTAQAPPGGAERGLVTRVLGSLAEGQREMDRIIRLAQTGRRFSPAELIGLQARVYRLSQELDLASKLVEKATSGVKQAMSTQV